MSATPIIVSYLLIYILHTSGHFLLTDEILQKRRRTSNKTIFLCYLMMYLVRAAFYFFMPMYLSVNIILSLALLFAMTLLYQASMIKRLMTTAFNYVLAMTGEVGATMMISAVLGKDITDLMSETGMTVMSLVLSGIITFALLLLSVRIFHTDEAEQTELTRSYLVAAFFVPTVSLLIVCVLAYTALQGNEIGSLFACLISAAILGINILVFYLYKKLQKEVKAENLSKMFGRTPAGLCLIMPDEKLTVIEANDIFYGILGTTREEAFGTGETSLFSLLDKETSDTLEKVRAELFSSQMDSGEIELSLETKNRRKRTILAKFYLDRGENTITANIIDITERKRMEERLRVSEERYRLALTQSGKVFFSFDVSTRTMHLSEELAHLFGIPSEIDNMPDNFITQGLLETESVEKYCQFVERIYAGEKSGDTIISCHMRDDPENIFWYRITFISIFDENKMPISAIITYEDINEQHKAELASKWKHLEAVLLEDKDYAIAVFDLTSGRMISWNGGDLGMVPETLGTYEEINSYILEHHIASCDRDALKIFLKKEHMQELHEKNQAEDSVECHVIHNDRERWAKLIVQLTEDPYNEHLMAQILLIDIEKDKKGLLDMKRDLEELQKELENSRIKVMINQMQPHFLYNALSSIQMITKRDPDWAYRLLHDFTVHLRSSIKALSSDELISFSEELDNVRAYLNIEKMRFSDKLHVVYEIESEDFKVIPLTIQPLVENAVKHGVFPKGKTGGTVTIRSFEKETSFVVEVEDDGTGFDVKKAMEEGNESYGLKNLVFRLQSLMNAEVLFDSKENSGTKVIVVIPKSLEEGETKDEDNISR
ncbi:MAG: PAS domain-containing protein [Clostridia bacterium]|nr:PAS domain-containing protein [Clostridia bacterium]